MASQHSDYARNIIGPVVQIGAYIFTTLFFNKQIGVLDLVFLFIIMFIFQVLQYKQGAIRCAEYFRIFYAISLCLGLLIIVFAIESMNYEDTERMWITLPGILFGLLRDSIIYIFLVLLCLLAVEFN